MRAPSPRGPSPPPAPGWRRRAAAAAAGGNSPSCCCGVSGGRLSRGRAGGRAAGLAAAFPRRRRLPRGDRPSLPAGSGFCRGAGLQFGRGVRLTPPRFSRASLGERASLRGVGGRGPAGGSGGTGRGERLALRGSPSQAERRLRGRSAPAGRGVCAGGPVRPSIPPPAAWRRRGAPPPLRRNDLAGFQRQPALRLGSRLRFGGGRAGHRGRFSASGEGSAPIKGGRATGSCKSADILRIFQLM